MDSTVLIVIIICIVGVAVGAVIFSLWFYMRQKKARLKLAEAEAMYGAKQEAERLKKANKKSWKQRLITRKTIRYVSNSADNSHWTVICSDVTLIHIQTVPNISRLKLMYPILN